MSQPHEPGRTEEQARGNLGLIAAAATAVVVLALIGGTTGYLLAGGVAADPSGPPSSPTASASASAISTPPSSSVSATVSAPPSTSASPAPPDGFRLPDVTDMDFEDAFRQLRAQRLGVQVFFGSVGDSRMVTRTEPPADELVWPGITVKLFVAGRPPLATVPGVVGLPCNDAGRLVAGHGLTPRYEIGRSGRVWRQDPAPGDDTVRWNDQVRLFCAAASPSPTSG